jgi:hypothetical protein
MSVEHDERPLQAIRSRGGTGRVLKYWPVKSYTNMIYHFSFFLSLGDFTIFTICASAE